jgi:hypothetical protein
MKMSLSKPEHRRKDTVEVDIQGTGIEFSMNT